jgi:hypothetical protein
MERCFFKYVYFLTNYLKTPQTLVDFQYLLHQSTSHLSLIEFEFNSIEYEPTLRNHGFFH